MDLQKSILRIFSANFLSMVTSIIIGFIVPAVLSVESYSLVKTYAFYISYIGFLHFGFIDGMYIKYGGKEFKDIDKSEFKSEHITFLVLQVLVTVIFLIISFVSENIILFLMGISILPINTNSFHQLFYQATGQFSKYAKISYLYTVIYLVMNILLAIIFRSQNYILYCLTTLIANGLVFVLLEYKFLMNMKGIKGHFNLKLVSNIKVGIFILIGNLSVMLFYAIDRWFIKIFFDISDFGYYSFAMSLLNIVNVLVSSISVTFYNYLSKGEDLNKIKQLKRYFVILGSFSSLSYFAFAAVITLFLTKYNPALSIIAISFAAYPVMIIINVLYVNLYKARKDERKYVKVVFFMVFISAIYNIIAIAINPTPQFIAIATTISFITWYIYSVKDFNYLKITIQEFVYLSVIIISFLLCSHVLNWFLGGIIYFLIVTLMSIFVYRKDIFDIINFLVKKR